MKSWLGKTKEKKAKKNEVKLFQSTDNFSAIVHVLVFKMYCTLRLLVSPLGECESFFLGLDGNRNSISIDMSVEEEKKL